MCDYFLITSALVVLGATRGSWGGRVGDRQDDGGHDSMKEEMV